MHKLTRSDIAVNIIQARNTSCSLGLFVARSPKYINRMDCIPWKAIRARRSRDPTQAGWPDAMASIEDTVRLAKLQPVAIRPHSALPKNKLSALIDPADIPEGGHVRSPSGNLLDAMQFEARQDRPPCIRERQQRILARVRSQASVANAEQVAPFTQDADEKEFGNRTTIEAGKRRSDSDSAKSSDVSS